MDVKMDKEPDSMIKPEYTPSEVYSSTSEPPPAYKLYNSNSVKIAKIVAVTIVLSSFILGSFILLSNYIQVQASNDQLEALNAILEKEMLLESLQTQHNELPKPEALLDNSEKNNELKDLSKDEMNKHNDIDEVNPDDVEPIDQKTNELDDDADEKDEDIKSEKKHIEMKIPFDFDLGALADAIFSNQQKSEEQPAEIQIQRKIIPFGMIIRSANFNNMGPNMQRQMAPPMQQFMPHMPFHRMGPMGPMGPQMQMHMQPPPQFQGPPMPMHMMNNNMPPMQSPFFRPQPEQFQQPPQQQPQVQQFPIPQQLPQQPPPQPQPQQQPQPQMIQPAIQPHPQFRMVRPIPITQLQQIQKEQPTFEAPAQAPQQEQKVEPVHRPAPEMRFLRQFELPSPIREILPFLNSIIQGDLQKESQEQKEESQKSLSEMASDYNSNESDSESDESDFPVKPEKNLSFMTEQVQQNNQDEQPKIALPLGRTAYGRSLILNPIRIPVPMTENTVMQQEPERAHYVHPRSI